MWGTTGVTINTKRWKELAPGVDPTSLDVIFDPAVAEKLATCGINMLDSPGTVVPMVLAYIWARTRCRRTLPT